MQVYLCHFKIQRKKSTLSQRHCAMQHYKVSIYWKVTVCITGLGLSVAWVGLLWQEEGTCGSQDYEVWDKVERFWPTLVLLRELMDSVHTHYQSKNDVQDIKIPWKTGTMVNIPCNVVFYYIAFHNSPIF